MIKPASPTSPPGSRRSTARADSAEGEAGDADEAEEAGDEADADERRDDARVLLLRCLAFAEAGPAVIASSPSAVPNGIGATFGAKRPHQKASLRNAAASADGFQASTIGCGSARSPEARLRARPDSSSMRASARSRPGRTPLRHAVEQARQISVRPATSCTRSTGVGSCASAIDADGRRAGRSFERPRLGATFAVEAAPPGACDAAAIAASLVAPVGSDTATSDRAIAGPRMRVVRVRQACFGSDAKPIVERSLAATLSGVRPSPPPVRRLVPDRSPRATLERRRARSVAHHGKVTAR